MGGLRYGMRGPVWAVAREEGSVGVEAWSVPGIPEGDVRLRVPCPDLGALQEDGGPEQRGPFLRPALQARLGAERRRGAGQAASSSARGTLPSGRCRCVCARGGDLEGVSVFRPDAVDGGAAGFGHVPGWFERCD